MGKPGQDSAIGIYTEPGSNDPVFPDLSQPDAILRPLLMHDASHLYNEKAIEAVQDAMLCEKDTNKAAVSESVQTKII